MCKEKTKTRSKRPIKWSKRPIKWSKRPLKWSKWPLKTLKIDNPSTPTVIFTLSTLKNLIRVLDLLPLHPHFLCILPYKPDLFKKNGIFKYYYNSDSKILLPGYKKMWLIQLLQNWYLITWENRGELQNLSKRMTSIKIHFDEESTKDLIWQKPIAQKIILTKVV